MLLAKAVPPVELKYQLKVAPVSPVATKSATVAVYECVCADAVGAGIVSVSYTHLDVYKRQEYSIGGTKI